jgi:uncharacterized protein YggE
MRPITLALALSLAAAPALAQTAAAQIVAPRAYEPAPWWMDKPILASTGYVWTEVPANRASTGATYEAVDRELAGAQKAAVEKVRAVSQALAAYGADKVRVETTFRVQPLYEQYRDKQGEMNTNARADKIERYQVSANLSVEIRDVRLAERVYATLIAAKPSTTRPVSFRLEPENETRTQMARLAVEDARRRALQGAEAARAHVGGVKLIDPTARACNTDVLIAGAPRYGDDTPAYRVPAPPPPPPPPALQEVMVTGSRAARDLGLDVDAVQMALQPPLQRLEARACVVYSLAGA